jgi:hypothetical protein
MKNIINSSKLALSGRAREKIDGPVSSWQEQYGNSRPQIAALVALASGGSHFVLHKLQGHPGIIALEQGELYPDLKYYFGGGSFPIQKIAEAQLLPSKSSLKDIEWIVLNKPQIPFVAKQYLFHREDIRTIFCFRNPIGLFHSKWHRKVKLGQKLYGVRPTWASVAKWISEEFLISLASFAQLYDSKIDGVVSLEALASQTDEGLTALFQFFNVPEMKNEELRVLEYCEECGNSLKKRTEKINLREEEVFFCPSCGRVYTGPGGYNYIRKVAPSNLAGWKDKEYSEELFNYFSSVFGSEMMNYFSNEDYLETGSHIQFKNHFDELMSRLKLKGKLG